MPYLMWYYGSKWVNNINYNNKDLNKLIKIYCEKYHLS